MTPPPTATQVTFPTPLSTATPYSYQPPPASAGNSCLISPVRAVDTRADAPGITHVGFDQTGAAIPVGVLQPGVTRRFLIAGQTFGGFTFPAGIKGVQLNVTAVPTAGFGGCLTLFPDNVPDANRPEPPRLIR